MSKIKPKYDNRFKIVLLGGNYVGKSNLLRRFVNNTYDKLSSVTIGVNLEIRTIQLAGKTIQLQVRDTPGHEEFRSLILPWFKNAHGFFILVYDVTNQESFNNVKEWLQEIDNYAGEKLLVGNKCDLTNKREVDYNSTME